MRTPSAVLPLQAIQKLLKSIWGKWNIQAIVVASLVFQTTLVFLAPFRKNSKKNFTLLVLWSVYLLSDYFATFAIGLINNNADDTSSTTGRIAAFWAPFLLIHLGGPHTITSFDVEDNDLWHRHLLTLLVQVMSVLLVFYRYEIYKYQELLIPTVIIFATGIIKYAERTRSLFLASTSYLRKSMIESSSSSDALRGSRGSKEGETVKTSIDDKELEMVYKGYVYYKLFKGFIVDHTLINIEKAGKLDEVKEFFSSLCCMKAFELLGMELNFMYDAMFTKMAAVQWMSSFGYAYRFVGHVLLLSVAITFFLCEKPDNVNPREISITYLLLGGAIVLDFIALVKLVFSEWTVAIVMEIYKADKSERPIPINEDRSAIDSVSKRWISWLINKNGRRRSITIMRKFNRITRWFSLSQRWSKEIRQYSLINHFLKSQSRWWHCVHKLLDYFGLTERIEEWRYTTTERVVRSLMELVFKDMKKKAGCSDSHSGGVTDNIKQMLGKLSYTDKEYHNCVLMWHIATEICYFAIPGEKGDQNPNVCRYISEYLMYFMVMEGKMTSTVPGYIGMRFRDMCCHDVRDTRDDLSKCLPRKKNTAWTWLEQILKDAFTLTKRRNNNAATCSKKDKKRKGACEWLLQKNLEDGLLDPESKLYKALQLAKHLKSCCNKDTNEGNSTSSTLGNSKEYSSDVENPNTDNPNKPDVGNCCSTKEFWESMSHVWAGLLSYAARHCRGDVQYLNKGGELLTFVRLLTVHFGLNICKELFKDEGGFKLEAEVN